MNKKNTVVITDKSRLWAVMLSGFFLAMATALTVYVNSSFLETAVSKTYVGLVFSIAFTITLFLLPRYGAVIERFKNHTTLLGVLFLQLLVTILMALNISALLTLFCFVLYIIFTTVTIVNYDIFLKRLTVNSSTGRIRGMFWTFVNLGFVFSPFFAGSLVERYGYGAAYVASAVALIPTMLIIWLAYRGQIDTIRYRKHERVRRTLSRIWRNHNLRGIFIIAVLLYLFYSWMVIYTPLFLLEAGYDWKQIGAMFTVMLIPFVIVEYPAGWLADRFFGETEMLTIGFILMFLSVVSLLVAQQYWVLMLVLFFSRVGASLVEIMRESYFYKQVAVSDIDMIDMFRNTASFGHLLGPLIASALLWGGLDLSSIFVVLSVVIVMGTGIPLMMKDTK